MEFKIDTKDSYSIVTPIPEENDANLAAQLIEKCQELQKSGTENFIIDLQHLPALENNEWDSWCSLHDDCYENQHSIVFIGAKKNLSEEDSEKMHIVPTLAEAIDIISMEILERELMNGEDWSEQTV